MNETTFIYCESLVISVLTDKIIKYQKDTDKVSLLSELRNSLDGVFKEAREKHLKCEVTNGRNQNK